MGFGGPFLRGARLVNHTTKALTSLTIGWHHGADDDAAQPMSFSILMQRKRYLIHTLIEFTDFLINIFSLGSPFQARPRQDSDLIEIYIWHKTFAHSFRCTSLLLRTKCDAFIQLCTNLSTQFSILLIHMIAPQTAAWIISSPQLAEN